MLLLKGSTKIVFDELNRALEDGEQPSIEDLADMTSYHESTVKTAIRNLVNLGLIATDRPGRGHKYTYQVLHPS